MTIAQEWLFASAREQAHAIRVGAITSLELVEAHLAQIERLNPQINAVVQVLAESALERARQADEAQARGESWGILHGVPFSVKDSFEMAGVVSTSGTLGRANYVPEEDAYVVRQLKDTGGIPIAKTNCPELVLPFETDNLVYGRTNNPHDLERTAGGSTGGEASLIAVGGSPLGVAADAGGSIRTPSHFNGICGIKSTTGRVSRAGHFPRIGGAVSKLSAAGTMARRVDDLILSLPLLIGFDPADPDTVPMPLGNPDDVDIMGMRIAYHTDNGIMPADDATASTVKRAVGVLMGHGARPVEAVPEGIDIIPDLLNVLFGADGGERTRSALERLGTPQISAPVQGMLDRWQTKKLTSAELMAWLGRWDGLRARLYAWMSQFSALITPVASMPAPPHGVLLGEDGVRILSYSILHNMAGLPAVSVPVGKTDAGLPIGVQIIAPPWREDVALALARTIEKATGGYQMPPLAQN
jgi:amidase